MKQLFASLAAHFTTKHYNFTPACFFISGPDTHGEIARITDKKSKGFSIHCLEFLNGHVVKQDSDLTQTKGTRE